MENIVMTVSKDGKKLTLEMDLTKRGGVSASGKSVSVATSRGNQPVPGTNLKLGINLFEPRNAQ